MTVSSDRLKQITGAIIMSLGATPEESALVAESLVSAEMRGIPTHGIHFLPMLVNRIDQGLLTVPTRVTTLLDEDAIAHIDGGNGLGQAAADLAMKKSIEKASRFGIGTAFVRNTNHIGLLAFYTIQAAMNGMIGICMSNSAASIAPWGGTEPFFGTNPFSVAAPCGGETPIVLDMSTSVVARGKIRRAIRLGEPIPDNWALDETGNPTTDPVAAFAGTLLPIGGPKGYGMAFFIDLISGLLSGSRFSRDVSTFHEPIGPTGVGVTMIAIDIRRFMPLDIFNETVAVHAASIRASRKGKAGVRIYLPGEIEAEREAAALKNGIELDEPVRAALDTLIVSKGIEVGVGI